AGTRGGTRGRSSIWRSVRRGAGAGHRLPGDLDLLSDMRAESISVPRQRVGGVSLAIFQRVVAAGGGAALIAGAAARRRAGLAARARGCTALSVRAACALTIGALVCIRIGLIGR